MKNIYNFSPIKIKIDDLLSFLRKHHTFVNFLDKTEGWLVKAGLWSIYLIIPILSVAIGINFGVNGWYILMCIISCMILGYIADKMLEYVKPTIFQSSTKIVNGAIFDVISVVFGLGGVVAFFVCLCLSIKHENFNICLYGLSILWACGYVLSLSLSPKKTLNIEIIDTATPAETFIGIVSFVVKAVYRLVPAIFGFIMILIVFNIVSLLGAENLSIFGAYGLIYGICTGTLMPFCGYLVFLSYYFIVDVFNSFLKMSQCVVSKDKIKQ